jgi:hypothetical protein
MFSAASARPVFIFYYPITIAHYFLMT